MNTAYTFLHDPNGVVFACEDEELFGPDSDGELRYYRRCIGVDSEGHYSFVQDSPDLQDCEILEREDAAKKCPQLFKPTPGFPVL